MKKLQARFSNTDRNQRKRGGGQTQELATLADPMKDNKAITALIADDERHVRMLIRVLLEDMGCQIIAEAADGAEAVAAFRRHRPDLTMLDITMPVLDGIEALRDIRVEFPDAFIIMLTGQASLQMVEQCLDLGAANYLRKDTPLGQMKTEIRESWLDSLAEAKASRNIP